MRVRTALASAFLLVVLVGALAAWRHSQSVSNEEVFETTLAEIARGDLRHARAVRKRLQQDSRYAAHRRLLGAAASFATGQPHAALDQLEPIPDDPTLRWRFQLVAAQSLHALGRFAEAESLLRQVLQDRPKQPDALRWLGMVYYDLGAMDHAVAPLTELADLQPDDYRPHWLLGVIYHDFERYPLAIQHLRAALDRAPPQELEPEIRGELARSLVANREYQTALNLLLNDPETALQMQLIAKCYFNLGDMDAARTWADKAAALDPSDPPLALLQAELFNEQGETSAALRVLRQATERYPHDPALRYQYSQFLRADGQVAAADQQLRIWEETGARRKRMVELNQQAIARPYDRAVREELAKLCRELNEPELAEMWQRAAESLRLQSPAGG